MFNEFAFTLDILLLLCLKYWNRFKDPVTTSFIFNEGKKREATLCVSDFDMCHLDFYLKNFFFHYFFSGKVARKVIYFFTSFYGTDFGKFSYNRFWF